MVFSFSFVWCCVVEDFLHEFFAFFGELPSPAWPVVSADAFSVDAVDVSRSFEFDHAASEALRRVMVVQCRSYCRQPLLRDWLFGYVEECDHVDLRGIAH